MSEGKVKQTNEDRKDRINIDDLDGEMLEDRIEQAPLIPRETDASGPTT